MSSASSAHGGVEGWSAPVLVQLSTQGRIAVGSFDATAEGATAGFTSDAPSGVD